MFLSIAYGGPCDANLAAVVINFRKCGDSQLAALCQFINKADLQYNGD